MQSFCHTATHPKPVEINSQYTLPDFIQNRGGVSLRPGGGIIHSWLNRMLLPDLTVEQAFELSEASAELTAVASVMGKLPTVEEYMVYATKIDSMTPEIYKYLNFDKMGKYVESAKRGEEFAVKLIA